MTELSDKRDGIEFFALQAPERVAVSCFDGTCWSRAALVASVNRLVRAFLAAGITQGSCVAVLAPNCPEFLVVCLAAVRAGVFVVPINWHLSDDELAHMVRDSEAAAIVVHKDLGQKRVAMIAATQGSMLISIGNLPGFASFNDFIAAHSPAPTGLPVTGRIMPYTSATTGRPKAVRLPAGNAERALRKVIAWHLSLGITADGDNVHLCTSMLYHSAPLEGAITALEMGHMVVLLGRWQPEMLLRAIESYRVTTTFLVPSMFVRLLKLSKEIRERYSTSSLRFVIHAGAPCPPDVKQQMLQWFGPIIWESYGAAEGQGTIVSPQEWLQKPGTVGRPIPGSDIKIIGEDNRELPAFCRGLVYFLPHTGDRFEYKGAPEETARSYRDNYITVGDIGYLDEDGYLYLCDRASDVILSSGMNIYPAEIEHVLIQHPFVADCAVIGIPHPLFGEVPKAFVQLERGALASSQLTAQLLGFLGGRISAMKTPQYIEYVDHIPRAPTGKLYRRLLDRNRTEVSRD